MEDFIKDLDKIASELKDIINKLPALAGHELLASIDDNFRNGSFYGAPWTPRKNDPDPERGILIGRGSGVLRRSIHMKTKKGRIILETDRPYAQIHNEGGIINVVAQVKQHSRRMFENEEVSGPKAKKAKWVKRHLGTIEVKAHSRKMNFEMTQRQFMGEHPEVDKLLDNLCDSLLTLIFG